MTQHLASKAAQDFDVFIGLEIHVQFQTKSKMFCTCTNHFGDRQNSNVCPVCLGFPGMLPVPNMQAIEYAYKMAHALNCELSEVVQFDRKNYYYPDLPKNYQITQFYNPVGRKGYFEYLYKGELRRISIHEVHLEEDAGKLVHGSDSSYCDYNRSGTPLMEVVTEPELHSSEETEELLKQFRRMTRYIGVSDGNMEEGSLRCDANISLNYKGKGLGTKVEIKNVNSFRFIHAALDYEIIRQATLLQEHAPVIQETRLWNENRDRTEGMRTKEIADDYRYFQEPDILPLPLVADFFDALKKNKEELPTNRMLRVQKEFGLEEEVLDFLIEEKAFIDYFEEVVSRGIDPRLLATWAAGDIKRLYKRNRLPFAFPPLSVERCAEFLLLVQEKKLHGKMAKLLLEKIFEEDADPHVLVEKHGLQELSTESLREIVQRVLSQQTVAVSQYKEGNAKSFGFLMGAVMKETGGKANPHTLRQELQTALEV